MKTTREVGCSCFGSFICLFTNLLFVCDVLSFYFSFFLMSVRCCVPLSAIILIFWCTYVLFYSMFWFSRLGIISIEQITLLDKFILAYTYWVLSMSDSGEKETTQIDAYFDNEDNFEGCLILVGLFIRLPSTFFWIQVW